MAGTPRRDTKHDKLHGDDNLLQLVSFKIGSEEFGVDILEVQEINRMVDITKVPQAAHYVEGVINLRGKVIPIIDLRKRFNMEVKEADKNTRIVVVDIDGSIMGMVVDSVSEVLRLPADTIEPAPEIVMGIDSEYIKGVAKLEDRLLIFLDLSKVVDARTVEETLTYALLDRFERRLAGIGREVDPCFHFSPLRFWASPVIGTNRTGATDSRCTLPSTFFSRASSW
jgi:purine-binding chemotaxis protein CheW